MKQLLIIGARGFGREMCVHALSCLGFGSDFVVKGFLDDHPAALDGFSGYPPIVGAVEDWAIGPDDVFFCALGDVVAKRRYVEMIQLKGGRFQTLIHASAIVFPSAKIGVGCSICANAHVSADVGIQEHTTVCGFATLGHDVGVGPFCHIGAYAFLGGYSRLGRQVTLHPRATVLPRITVGDEAVVGAGSVVLRNVKAGTTVFGNPATTIDFPFSPRARSGADTLS